MTSPLGGRYGRCKPLDTPFLKRGGYLTLSFILGFVEIPGLKAVVFPIVAYQVPPSLLPAVEQAT